MERRISIKNLYLVGVISIGLIGLGVGSTFAMFTASAEISDSISITSGLSYTKDVVDLVDMTISSNKVETATLNITNNTDKTLNYTSWYKTNDSNLQIGTVVSNDYSVTGTIAPNASTQIIVSIRNRSAGVAKVTVGISASESDIVVSNGVTTLPSNPLPPYLNDYITSLYTSNTKSDVTNNSITYHYATDVNLMNDRLGDSNTDIDSGNIRYYGSDPSNYIDIGDKDSNDNAILYRIVGVFDNKVKIVRNNSIGNYAYDISDSTINDGNGINEWSGADLMKVLNPGYTSSSSYWNNGINSNAKKLIQSTTWNLGGISLNSVYANNLYTSERGTTVIASPSDNIVRTTAWTGKIGLIYPSDIGYASNLDGCSSTFDSYSADSNCSSYLLSGNYWTISPSATDVSKVYTSTSLLDGSSEIAVRPSFYLIEDTVLESGAGTSADPYVVD